MKTPSEIFSQDTRTGMYRSGANGYPFVMFNEFAEYYDRVGCPGTMISCSHWGRFEVPEMDDAAIHAGRKANR